MPTNQTSCMSEGKNIEKRFKNESGDLLVRSSGERIGGCGVVEIIYLNNQNKSGYVIGYWELRNVDGSQMAEFRSVHDRIMTAEYDDARVLLEVLKFGQKLADLIIETL